jgi:hypothetical protein
MEKLRKGALVAAPALLSIWPFWSAYNRYNEYQYLQNVALPHFRNNPVQSTGIESHNIVASRIENVDMPDVYERFCENLGIGLFLLAFSAAAAISRIK